MSDLTRYENGMLKEYEVARMLHKNAMDSKCNWYVFETIDLAFSEMVRFGTDAELDSILDQIGPWMKIQYNDSEWYDTYTDNIKWMLIGMMILEYDGGNLEDMEGDSNE